MDYTEGEKLKYDPSGPFQKSRTRTDSYWLVGFLCFFLVWMIVIIYAFSVGDISKWDGKMDYAGRVCGKDVDAIGKPYLYSNAYRICLSECPDVDFTYTNQEDLLDSGNDNKTLFRTKKLMICRPDVKLNLVTEWYQLDELVETKKCIKEYRKSIGFDGQCDTEMDFEFNYELWQVILPKMRQDIDNTKYSIMGFILLSGLITVLSMFLMRWYALSFVCVSIFILCAVIFHLIYEQCVLNAESKTNGVLLALFLCVVVLGLVVLISLYFRRQIYLACQMISESSKAITCILSSLILPLIVFTICILLLVLGVSVCFTLTTIESPVHRVDYSNSSIETCECPENLDYSQNSSCTPYEFDSECKTLKGEPCLLSGCFMTEKKLVSAGFLQFLNVIGLYWTFAFIIGFGNMVLTSVFATWYWTFNKKILSYLTVVESFWRVSMYHLGTVALGSLIILICTIIWFMLRSLYKGIMLITKYVAFCAVFGSCINVVEGFLNFIHQRAYIMCSVHGTNFLHSGRMAFYLIMRNLKRVFVVFEMTSWLILILSILISGVTTRIAVSYYMSRPAGEITFVFIPPLIVFVGAWIMTWLLFRVVQLAVDTIFLCFLEDIERNDGSSEKPYFMSDELSKFLYKKENM